MGALPWPITFRIHRTGWAVLAILAVVAWALVRPEPEAVPDDYGWPLGI